MFIREFSSWMFSLVAPDGISEVSSHFPCLNARALTMSLDETQITADHAADVPLLPLHEKLPK